MEVYYILMEVCMRACVPSITQMDHAEATALGPEHDAGTLTTAMPHGSDSQGRFLGSHIPCLAGILICLWLQC